MDFIFRNHGSICLLKPVSTDALRWVADNIPEDAQTWAGAIVIEPRYAEDILIGIAGDGLEVSSGTHVFH